MLIQPIVHSIMRSCALYEEIYHFQDYTIFVTRDLFAAIQAEYPQDITCSVAGQTFFRSIPIVIAYDQSKKPRYWIGFNPEQQ